MTGRSPRPLSEQRRVDVAVVGSGFAGTIAARVARSLGLSAALLERGSHPRTALGESSTPLAAISLEALAERYSLPDLRALGAYGRWSERLPHLGRGLKRGFTFYGHRPNRSYRESAPEARRLLVAASPDDEVADLHWWRADVDAHLVERAVEEGVLYLDRTEIGSAEETGSGLRLSGARCGKDGAREEVSLDAGFVIDATGPGALVPTLLGIFDPADTSPGDGERLTPPTALVAGHFTGVPGFSQTVAGAVEEPVPYPPDRAAVHHLLGADGWMYLLRFDGPASDGSAFDGSALDGATSDRAGGVTSAGFVLRRDGAAYRAASEAAATGASPEEVFRLIAGRYPDIAAQLSSARPIAPVRFTHRLGHRRSRAVGARWLLLPGTYAFFDPLFSTGIAWSLAGVERVGEMLAAGPAGSVPALVRPADLKRYEALLRAEADHVDRLVAGAYRAMAAGPAGGSPGAFALTTAWSRIYFAAASFSEARRRLGTIYGRTPREVLPPGGSSWAWEGFLGASDPVLSRLPEEGLRRLPQALSSEALGCAARGSPALGSTAAGSGAPEGFEAWVREAIEPRNVAGLADPARGGLYPVDFAPLIAGAPKLGFRPEEVREALPRMRG